MQVEKRADKTAEKRPRFRAKGWGYDMDFGGDIIVNPPPPPVATVTVSPSTARVLVGATQQFTIELRDSRGNLLSGRSVTWESNAPGVALKGETGFAKAMAPGTATFTARSEGKSGSATVTVPPPKLIMYSGSPAYPRDVSSFGIVAPSLYDFTGYVDRTRQLYVYAYYTDCFTCPPVDRNAIQWSSSDSAKATVRPLLNGTGAAAVTGLAEGSTEIRATHGGTTLRFYTYVTKAPVAWITLSPTSLTLEQGKTGRLTATLTDPTRTTLTDRVVTWSSTNTAVATVGTTTGTVFAVAPGDVMITATSEGAKAGATVKVNPPPVATVTVTPDPVSLEVGGGWTQLAVILKDAAGNVLTDRTVEWRSTNATIADVDGSGRAVGIASDTTRITATSEGRVGSATVIVSSPPATLRFNW